MKVGFWAQVTWREKNPSHLSKCTFNFKQNHVGVFQKLTGLSNQKIPFD